LERRPDRWPVLQKSAQCRSARLPALTPAIVIATPAIVVLAPAVVVPTPAVAVVATLMVDLAAAAIAIAGCFGDMTIRYLVKISLLKG
jgi:hypothetical protein